MVSGSLGLVHPQRLPLINQLREVISDLQRYYHMHIVTLTTTLNYTLTDRQSYFVMLKVLSEGLDFSCLLRAEQWNPVRRENYQRPTPRRPSQSRDTIRRVGRTRDRHAEIIGSYDLLKEPYNIKKCTLRREGGTHLQFGVLTKRL